MKFTKVVKAEELKKEIPYKDLAKLRRKVETLEDIAKSTAAASLVDTRMGIDDYERFMNNYRKINDAIDEMRNQLNVLFKMSIKSQK